MVRGLFTPDSTLRVLTAKATSEATLTATSDLFRTLGCMIESEHDPDLPMLLKNMNATVLS